MLALIGAIGAAFAACLLLLPHGQTKPTRERAIAARRQRLDRGWPALAPALAALAWLLTREVAASVAVVGLCLLAPTLRAFAARAARKRAVSSQMIDALTLLANSLRAGLSLTQGIQNLGHDVAAPVGEEFRQVATEISFGASVPEALTHLTSRLANDDVRLFVTAVLVQRQTGGNLATVLSSLASTIRERHKLAEKVKTATAQGRMSGAVIAGLPPVMAVAIAAVQPGYFRPLTGSLAGWILMGLMVLMNALGWAAINRMCKVTH